MTSTFRAFAACFILICLPVFANAQTNGGQISVSGEGSVTIVPDMARIMLGVMQEAETAAEATAAMSADLTDVLATLVAAGIAETYIQTSGLRIDPRYDYKANNNRPFVVGYIAQSNVTVRVFDLDDLGSILDQVVSNGANQMNGLQFDVKDRAPHLGAARKAAVVDALSKAGVFADAAGVALGDIIALSESGAARPQQFQVMSRMEESSAVPIAAGDMTISAQVSITFGIAK